MIVPSSRSVVCSFSKSIIINSQKRKYSSIPLQNFLSAEVLKNNVKKSPFALKNTFINILERSSVCFQKKSDRGSFGHNDDLLQSTEVTLTIYDKVCEFYRRLICPTDKHQSASKMSISVEAMAQLENNSQTADNLIKEIYSKLAILQNCNPEMGAEVQKILKENEALKQEVDKWKEMVILQQIRNGENPVVRDPRLIERSTPLVAATPIKQEPVTPVKQEVEVKQEAASPAQQQQQGKKTKKGGDGGGKTPAPPKAKGESADAQGNEEVDVGRLDLRIGLIKECSRHPDADSLYVEKIDVGEPNVRTVISGLVKHVPIEQMQNRMVVVLCNLKPSKMRGITSEAMVMCASSPEKVEILIPPSGSVPGDVIEVEGFTRRPDAVLNPKKKIFETVAPDLKTNDNKQATYKGAPWTVPGKGFVVSESLCNVNVK